MKLKVLDVCSGIGGFSLGLEATGGFETVAFCDNNPYCRARLRDHWPSVPIYNDIKEIKGNEFPNIDVLCGGFPCQPYSQAGLRAGEEDDRHLWPEMYRLVVAFRPAWILFENVVGLITLGLDDVLADLESAGYTCWPIVIPAVAVDAPHRRDRVWIVGYREREGLEGHARHGEDGRQPGRLGAQTGGPAGTASLFEPAADAECGVRGGRADQSERRSQGGNAAGRDSEGDGCGPLADADDPRQPQQQGTESEGGRRVVNGGQAIDVHSHCRDGSCCAEPNKCDGNNCWLAKHPGELWRYVSDAKLDGPQGSGAAGEASPARRRPAEPGGPGPVTDTDGIDADGGRYGAGEVRRGRPEQADIRRSQQEDMADTEGDSVGPGLCKGEQGGKRRGRSGDGGGEDVSDHGRGRGEGPGPGERGPETPARWLPEPDVGRVAHGIPNRVDRLKTLGNAVLPPLVTQIGYAIHEAHFNDIEDLHF